RVAIAGSRSLTYLLSADKVDVNQSEGLFGMVRLRSKSPIAPNGVESSALGVGVGRGVRDALGAGV
ncbi:MAG TPA: hypothetical protein VGW96_00055, partial [Candidatus Eremiobacteraceae bacterium]|nr:hypothetical protein [Candidatus Eremiobacteraceae bacterium]